MTDLDDLTARYSIMRRRRALRLPDSAKNILTASFKMLHERETSRAWKLPATSVATEVPHYYARHKTLKAKGPRPRLRTSVTCELAEEIALKVDSALNFAELGRGADPLVRPILLYYACSHLCGVYTRAFFEWEVDNRAHGVSCNYKRGDIANTTVKIADSGQFPRVAVTCFLLTGQPSAFSPLITYSGKPTAETRPNEPLQAFGNKEIGVPVKDLTLDTLMSFNFGAMLRAVRTHHGFHKFHGLPTTAFLIDVLILFLGSSLARYDVLGWKRILEGRDNSYRIQFEEAYERFLTFGIDLLLALLENPIASFDKRLIRSQPSPYSQDDHFRFNTDPNYGA